MDDAVKLAKTLPGFEKSKKHYKVTFGKTDSGSDDLWELLKIASRWKGAVFLFDGKEVDQEVWESSFRQTSVESGDAGETAAVVETAVAPPKAEEPPKTEEKPEKVEEPPKVEEKKPEEALEPPKAEEKKPEKAPESPKAEEKKPEKAPEPPKAEEKEPVKAEEKKPAAKPVSVQINPAPKPKENSGCGKSAAMFAIAALGLLQFFR